VVVVEVGVFCFGGGDVSHTLIKAHVMGVGGCSMLAVCAQNSPF
jgi:hypothetical protein